MPFLFVIALILVTSGAAAQDWALRDTDTVLSRDEVQELTLGQTITFYDDGQSKYSAAGDYSYTYASGESAFGKYMIQEDGTVCIAYQNGFGRCDRYVQSESGRIVLLTESGLRFPIRPVTR